ncbi:FAD linked oxidase domain protein [Thermaerobacter marianensis DSM 12885]|uniref:FAD linked oxidase domain protein n=1 Tax=Thermaerobacter marianensis (strain ATCC 700841 / DSM 12885 / JCM 10246 / 7p75a) TaxID=644966 RepID=E6SMM3_THEM7|nr:FAD-binding oxidoreductase [Thermaerobacter marianensis]ADU51515.1 FAD linked oxidase domain protein [Thermaerobacter marianensis DSM 12885]
MTRPAGPGARGSGGPNPFPGFRPGAGQGTPERAAGPGVAPEAGPGSGVRPGAVAGPAAAVRPRTVDEVAALVREARRVVPRGGGTKAGSWPVPPGAPPSDRDGPEGPGSGDPRAAATSAGDDVLMLDTTGLEGIVEYDPAEFTVTARAGTRVADLEALLARHGQYLPFDPLRTGAGATLGGTVAMGVSGACRLRFGGVRDFVLGVTFVDGEGRVIRGGGRVVKNAAGYDLPKFLCGSMGRFGILAELTFKVFPRPEAFATVVFPFPSLDRAAAALEAVYRSPLEPHALELAGPGVGEGLARQGLLARDLAGQGHLGPDPVGRGQVSCMPAPQGPMPQETARQGYLLLVRVGGPAAILPAWADRVIRRVREALGMAVPAEVLGGEAEGALWRALSELAWVPGGPDRPGGAAGAWTGGDSVRAPRAPAPLSGGVLLRLYSRPSLLAELDALLDGHGALRLHSQAATAAWAFFPDEPAWDRLLPALQALGVPALQWQGPGPLPGGFVVPPAGTAVARALKQVFDPRGRFLPLPWADGA